MVIAHKLVRVSQHSNEPKATYMLSPNPRCKYYDHTKLGKTRMKCIGIYRYIDNILFLYYLPFYPFNSSQTSIETNHNATIGPRIRDLFLSTNIARKFVMHAKWFYETCWSVECRANWGW